MGIKVFRYALIGPPFENEDLVRRQMRLAHEYRNKLVEIARKERAEVRQLQQTHGSIVQLEAVAKQTAAAAAAAYDTIKRHKAAGRTRQVPDGLKQAYGAAKAARATAARDLMAARAALRSDPTIVVKRDEISERYQEERRKARATCGVYWGTYLTVEAADQQASKMPLWDGITPNDPGFSRWSGEGLVATQIQGGIAVTAISTSRHVRISSASLPPKADPMSKRSAKHRDYYKHLSLRVGTVERDPVWAQWKMVMHRPLPEDGVIKWVSVKLQKCGPREEWHVLFTVESPDTARPVPEESNRVAVDVGWRVREDGIRIAAWRSDQGEHGTLVLPNYDIDGFSKADSLRSIRDKAFIKAQSDLVAKLPSLALPDWFPKNIYQWRSVSRLAKLVLRWSTARFGGDEEAFAAAEAWRRQDHHLWEWETSQRAKSLRVRKEKYRRFAAQMARRYTSLVIEDFDLSRVASVPSAEAQEDDNAKARANRQRVAVSELRTCLVQAFRGDFVAVPPEYTTKTCATCASIEEWDQKKEVDHTCSKCGAHWDQDDNAARNLLSYREQSGGSETTGVARGEEDLSNGAEVRESKWTKAKRMSVEKTERMRAAREATPNPAE